MKNAYFATGSVGAFDTSTCAGRSFVLSLHTLIRIGESLGLGHSFCWSGTLKRIGESLGLALVYQGR